MAEQALSRRGFLAATGCVAATVAAGYSGFSDWQKAYAAKGDDGLVMAGHSACNGCFSKCGYSAYTKDGRLNKIVGDAAHPYGKGKLCARGYGYSQIVYNENRLTDPLRRTADGKFEKITWDEAFDEIATKWKGFESQYGPNANIICWGTGSLNGDGSNVWCNRMANVLGYPQLSTQFDSNGLTAFPRTFGYTTAALGNDSRMVPEAKRIFVWGANPTESCPPTWYWDILAIENGARMTVIDPIYTIAASKAHDYVPSRVAPTLCWPSA